jgi:hypothetical protein
MVQMSVRIRRRYQEFMRSRLAVPLDEVKAWVAGGRPTNCTVRNRD